MCMNSMKRILLYLTFVRFIMANQNLDDDFVPVFWFLPFLSKMERSEIFLPYRGKKTQFLLWLSSSMEETRQPCLLVII